MFKSLTPRSHTEAAAALHIKPRSPHQHRMVYLNNLTHRGYKPHLDVIGPTGEGDRLTIITESGFNHLRVLSGNVHIVTSSSWGDPVEILPEAAATTSVYVDPDVKATITGPIRREALSGDLSRTWWDSKYTRLADGSSVLTDAMVSA